MGDNTNNHARLKARQRAERDNYPANLGLRVHRAISWLHRAEQEADPDARFIFLWIAFNAAYASEIDAHHSLGEQSIFNEFLHKLCDLDRPRQFHDIVWTTYPNAIRLLLDNCFVFPQFWEYQKGHLTQAEWTRKFAGAKKAANAALAQQNTPKVLSIVFDRIYTLRNQLIHGGATWNSGVNREQIRDCAAILGQLVPVVIETMMDNPNSLWGEAVYPVVE